MNAKLNMLILSNYAYFWIIKEFFFRSIQDNLKNPKSYRAYVKMVLLGMLMDNFIIAMIFSFGWANFVYMTINLSYFVVWIRFSLIQQITAGWIYRYSRGNILASSIYSSIIYAGLAVLIFPSYGFL